MLSFLFKPKWQHRDASVRATAVAEARDPALLTELPRLAKSDPDAQVRLAALERLNDPALCLHAALHDATDSVRQRMRKRVQKDALLAGDAGPWLALLSDADTETLERFACDAKAPALRRAALERIERMGWLADRALADPDPAIRLWLAGRITPGPSLERLAESARTRDKRVYKAVRERLDGLRSGSDDPQRIEAEGLALCRQLESLLQHLPADAAAQADQIEVRWNGYGAAAPAALETRFRGTLQTVRHALHVIAHPPEPQVAVVDIEAAAPAPVAESAPSAPADLPDAELDALITRAEAADADPARIESLRHAWGARWSTLHVASAVLAQKHRFDAALAVLRAREAELAAAREARVVAVQTQLAALETALDGGHARDARAADEQISSLLQAASDHPGAAGLRQRHARLRQRLQKLGDWQRWSGNQARAELCTEMEALPGLGLHPDALAAKVKELQQRMARIDQAEGLSAEAAKAQGLGRRFRALAHAALKPAQGYFEKRAEVRQRHTADIATQIQQVETLLQAEPIDVPALLEAKRQLSDTFRELDRTDPARRAELAKQMKTLLERISARIDAAFAAVAAEKDKLIAQLTLKLKHASRAEAVDAVKATQQRFKQAGRGQRAADQRQWEALRALADPVFAGLQADREAQTAASAAQRAALVALVDAVQAQVAEVAVHPGAVPAAVAELTQRWRAMEDRTPDLERAFEQATAAVQTALEAQQQARRAQRQVLLQQKVAWLADLEHRVVQGETLDVAQVQAAWAGFEALESTQETALKQRLDHLLASGIDRAQLTLNDLEAQRQILLLELLEGRPSPADHQDARRALQVERLAAHLSGQRADAAHEASQVRARLLLLGPLSAAVRAELAQRLG